MLQKIFGFIFFLFGASSCVTTSAIKNEENNVKDLIGFSIILAGDEPVLIERLKLFKKSRKEYYIKYREFN